VRSLSAGSPLAPRMVFASFALSARVCVSSFGTTSLWAAAIAPATASATVLPKKSNQVAELAVGHSGLLAGTFGTGPALFRIASASAFGFTALTPEIT